MTYFIFWIIAFGSSFIGASIGLGGGIIALPIYLLVTHNDFNSSSLYTVFGMVFLSLLSVYKYSHQKILLHSKKILPLIIGAAVGSAIGNYYIIPFLVSEGWKNSFILNIILVIYILISTGILFFKSHFKSQHWNDGYLVFFGLFGALFSSVFGIGTSSVVIPTLIILYSMNFKEVPIISLFLTLMVSIISILSKFIILNIHPEDWFVLIPIAIGAIFGGILGPMLNRRLKTKQILIFYSIVRILSVIGILLPGFLIL